MTRLTPAPCGTHAGDGLTLTGNRRHGRSAPKGFTLLELVVTGGIVAVLTVMLLPSLVRVRQNAAAVKCLNNLRQFGKANQMFAMDNDQFLPFSNWDGGNPLGYINVRKGWLYEPPLPPAPAGAETVMSGDYWPYVKDLSVYHCPLDTQHPGTVPGFVYTNKLTSYLMSGAMSSAERARLVNGKYEKLLHRISEFKPADIMMWEADERGGSGWNDGASYPGETYIYIPKRPYSLGLSVHHGNKAAILRIDGVAEFIEHEEFYRLAVDPKRNRLWCDPYSPNGHY